MTIKGMSFTLVMDRPIDKDKHYISPGGYVLNGKCFDFCQSEGSIDQNDPTKVHFEVSDIDEGVTEDDFVLADIMGTFSEFFVYTGEADEPEINPVAVEDIQFLFNETVFNCSPKTLESANKCLKERNEAKSEYRREKEAKPERSREEILLSMLADTIPNDPNEFNSETGYGEPQHWMSLPYDRSLEIVYEETGDDHRYYSWRIHCNEQEFDKDDFHGTMGIIDQNNTEDLSFDSRLSMINWAIKVALKKPAT